MPTIEHQALPFPLIHDCSRLSPKDGKTRCTTGSVVLSLYHLKDSENENRDAGFFVFPDLSVHQEGSYRLKFSLFGVVGCVPHIIFPLLYLFSSHSCLPLSPDVLFHIRHKSHIFDPNKCRSFLLFEIRTFPFHSTRGSISFRCVVFLFHVPSHSLMILK
jgi:Velvet factor